LLLWGERGGGERGGANEGAERGGSVGATANELGDTSHGLAV